MKKQKKEIQQFDKNKKKSVVPYVIGQVDGVMLPTRKNDPNASDQRKGKVLGHREARLVLGFEKGVHKPIYDASFGEKDEIGELMAYCVNAAGRKEHTKMHFVCDGALWIYEQVEKHFGSDATFLIDFYHMSEYLAGASQCCSPSDKDSWRRSMQALMKESKVEEVLNILKSHIDEAGDCLDKAADDKCLAKICYNYIKNRPNQFDYKGALEQGLPIGSGKVESGHRNVLQKRLKVPGAWWLEENAGDMIGLRIVRENGFWEDYWKIAGTVN
jgi:hypothetical protein